MRLAASGPSPASTSACFIASAGVHSRFAGGKAAATAAAEAWRISFARDASSREHGMGVDRLPGVLLSLAVDEDGVFGGGGVGPGFIAKKLPTPVCL